MYHQRRKDGKRREDPIGDAIIGAATNLFVPLAELPMKTALEALALASGTLFTMMLENAPPNVPIPLAFARWVDVTDEVYAQLHEMRLKGHRDGQAGQ